MDTKRGKLDDMPSEKPGTSEGASRTINEQRAQTGDRLQTDQPDRRDQSRRTGTGLMRRNTARRAKS